MGGVEKEALSDTMQKQAGHETDWRADVGA